MFPACSRICPASASPRCLKVPSTRCCKQFLSAFLNVIAEQNPRGLRRNDLAESRLPFNQLFYRRGDPRFYAFDLLFLNGRDLRNLPLVERKARLRKIIPPQPSRVLLCDHIEECGEELFAAACARDLEGIVAKWKQGKYVSGPETSWVKIKNPAYSQLQGRREQFDRTRKRVASARK